MRSPIHKDSRRRGNPSGVSAPPAVCVRQHAAEQPQRVSVLLVVLFVLGVGLRVLVLLAVLLLVGGRRRLVFVLLTHCASPPFLEFSSVVCTYPAKNIRRGLEKRPKIALERKVIGHMEADTIVGKRGGACIVTMVDMTSRFLLGGKSTKKDSDSVKEVMLGVLNSLPSRKKKTITPDRGKEFACHEEITQETGIEFYFPRPHSPWDRGTNENTNGLLREYIPKSTDIDALSEEEIAAFFDKLNKRPRKCLGWKTPFEVFYNKVLHLV